LAADEGSLSVMRILALDVGDVRIGVAISDLSQTIAQGLDSIIRKNNKEDIKAIKNILDQYEVEKIVIGLPKTMSNEIGIQAEKVLNFTELIKKEIGIPLITWDERFTTVVADRVLIDADLNRRRRKKVIDKVAATLILQGYLDSYKRTTRDSI
jgi:putative Holliday junction resolvase